MGGDVMAVEHGPERTIELLNDHADTTGSARGGYTYLGARVRWWAASDEALLVCFPAAANRERCMRATTSALMRKGATLPATVKGWTHAWVYDDDTVILRVVVLDPQRRQECVKWLQTLVDY